MRPCQGRDRGFESRRDRTRSTYKKPGCEYLTPGFIFIQKLIELGFILGIHLGFKLCNVWQGPIMIGVI
jgi:hypothetical protein